MRERATFEVHQPDGARSELLLLAAVLVRAVRDLVFYSSGRTLQERRIAAEALEWIFEPSTDDRCITSFHGICQALNLDSASARDRILDVLPAEARTLHQRRFGGCQ